MLDTEVVYLNLREKGYPLHILGSSFYNHETNDFIHFQNVNPDGSSDNFQSPSDKYTLPGKNTTLMSWYFDPDGVVINQ